MAVKTQFSQQDFIYLLSQYDLGTYSQAYPISEGTVQTNYLLTTTHGKFVFKYYDQRPIESVLFESDLLVFLHQNKYPIPELFQNKKNETVSTYQGKPYVIMAFIEGKTIENPNTYHQQQLIQKVAELHLLTHKYEPRFMKYRWNYNIELCRELADIETRKIDTDDARGKFSWLESQLAALDLPGTLPKGICHCDPHYSNILYQGDQLVGLLDFDDANYVLNFARAREIVQTYNRFRPLNKVEQRHIYDIHKLSILYDCIWFYGRGQVEDFYERRKIEFLNYLGWKKYSEALFHD